MTKKLTFKQVILSTFRELFIHHHTSLEFRAKLFAMVIAADRDFNEHCSLQIVNNCGMEIYHDTERVKMLTLTTKEYVLGALRDDDQSLESLIKSITSDLVAAPRYAKKIEIEYLKDLQRCTTDEDTKIYQDRIIEFLERVKKEYEK